MQVYAKSNRLSLKIILLFIAVLFLAYLPVSTFLFFLKNDAFNGYFPPKFFMSESIHAGYLPLWNPYINFGIPQYGDMSGGYWSPVTWLVASTVGYNAYTFTIEVLFYILLGGIGVYKLTGLGDIDKRVRLIAGIAFMCGGYNIGHLQHFNWVSGAAFLPWCLWSYYLLFKNGSKKKAVLAAVFFYLLIASAHPGITIGAFYFFSALTLFFFFTNEGTSPFVQRLPRMVNLYSIFLVCLLLLSAGMIVGYLDIIPHFVRGEKVSLSDSLLNPTSFQSWISAILPFSTVKNDHLFQTDISMRNCYFSLVLFLFFIKACVSKKSSWQKFLLVTGLFFVLLSAGGFFKMFAYKFIPLVGYVRLNGEFRIFALICFILLASLQLNKFIQNKQPFHGAIKRIYYVIEILVFGTIIFGIYMTVSTHDSFIFRRQEIMDAPAFSMKLKGLLDAISFYDTLWLQGTIQLFILWGIKWCLKFGNWNLLVKIVVADMIIACLLNIPFTGVGKASVADVQAVLNKSPIGIPIPDLEASGTSNTINMIEASLVGDWSFYNKQPGAKQEAFYPIALKNMRQYFEQPPSDRSLIDSPYIFLINPANAALQVNAYSPNSINLTVTAASENELVFKQNFYPHWYYQNGNEKREVNQYGINFMSVPVIKGTNNIVISFEPRRVKIAMAVSLTVLVLCLVLLFTLKSKPPSPS